MWMKTSVALCTYNGEKYLNQQIDSILKQSIKVDEIIVCDDGSLDSTLSILEQYQKKHPSLFKIFVNKENLRSMKNFEKAISLCNHDIIFLCDQDDLWIPEKVKIYLTYFNENPKIKVIASNGFAIDDHGKLLDVLTIWDIVGLVRKLAEVDFFSIINLSLNFVTGATMAIRKDYLTKVLPFPMIDEYHHDEWIAMIASLHGQFAFIDDKTIYYRQHKQQQVGGVFYENTEKMKNNLIKLLTPDFTKTTFSNYKMLLKRIAAAYAKNKNYYDKSNRKNKIFKNNSDLYRALFFKLRREMKIKFPLNYFLLNKLDKVSNKRRL